MNTAIIAPKNSLAKIDKMVPKPTKTEIINAMVERARVKHELDEEARKIKKAALEKKILALAKKGIKTGKHGQGYINSWGDEKCVEFTIWVKSPEITALIRDYNEVESRRHFDAKRAKEAIRAKLTNEPSRVNLLSDPEAVKAIDAKLEEWSM